MGSIVYFTDQAPSGLAQSLRMAGHEVWEALSVSEVLHLCEYQKVDAVVIAAVIPSAHVVGMAQRWITIRLSPSTTAEELLWELGLLFPGSPSFTDHEHYPRGER